jgi:molecular chaperone DnaK
MSDDIAVGIDLGTSNSVITVVLEGQPIIIPDDEGNAIHPSLVHYGEDGTTTVGNPAKDLRIDDPEHTVYSVKRLMGRRMADPAVKMMRGSYPYPIVSGESGGPHIEMRGEQLSPEEVSATILEYLTSLAESYLGQAVDQAVITVPANFDEAQRRATQHAAQMADLEVLRLINEPTAAALAYGYEEGRRERIGIYDFGGGTFDISILELRDNVFEVVSTAGNSFLGGDDFDYRIVQMIMNAFEKQHGYDLSGDESVRQRLKALAQNVKHRLTDQETVRAKVTEYVPGTLTELDLEFTLTRDAFNRRCDDIVDESLETCRNALQAASMQRAELDHLVMVGGTTRMPLVRRKVAEFFNREPIVDIDPDEVVSIGAAIFASSMISDRQAPPAGHEGEDDQEGPLLIDVTPHALGVATVGGVVDIVIEQNASLPLERSRSFSTSRDDQTRVRLPVYAGNSRRVEDNRQLGELVLADIEPGPREDVQIDVTFRVDTDGMLDVEAVDRRTGQRQSARLSIMGDNRDDWGSPQNLATTS